MGALMAKRLLGKGIDTIGTFTDKSFLTFFDITLRSPADVLIKSCIRSLNGAGVTLNHVRSLIMSGAAY